MAAGSLDSHRMTQHVKARERKWAWTDAATGGEEQKTYRMESPKGGDNGMPSRRVPGEGGDEDGDVRAFMEEARAGHNHQVGGNVRAHNDGGRTDNQGEEEGKSDMWGLWKVDGGGIT